MLEAGGPRVYKVGPVGGHARTTCFRPDFCAAHGAAAHAGADPHLFLAVTCTTLIWLARTIAHHAGPATRRPSMERLHTQFGAPVLAHVPGFACCLALLHAMGRHRLHRGT